MFDAAEVLLLFDVGQGRFRQYRKVILPSAGMFQRVRLLRDTGVQVLICGAVSGPMETALISAGIRVVSCTCGRVDEVVEAYANGKLTDKAFLMPGCTGRNHGSKSRGITLEHPETQD